PSLTHFCFFRSTPRPPTSTLFPYTTLFRSRASANSKYRVTYITSEDQDIGAGECHVYQVPIPTQLRNPADDHRIRIDVTLSYVADRKSTRLNSSHVKISYAVFCLKKKTQNK